MKNNLLIISLGIVLGFLIYLFSYDSSPAYLESSTEKVQEESYEPPRVDCQYSSNF